MMWDLMIQTGILGLVMSVFFVIAYFGFGIINLFNITLAICFTFAFVCSAITYFIIRKINEKNEK